VAQEGNGLGAIGYNIQMNSRVGMLQRHLHQSDITGTVFDQKYFSGHERPPVMIVSIPSARFGTLTWEPEGNGCCIARCVGSFDSNCSILNSQRSDSLPLGCAEKGAPMADQWNEPLD
jgi:hypothetical protein